MVRQRGREMKKDERRIYYSNRQRNKKATTTVCWRRHETEEVEKIGACKREEGDFRFGRLPASRLAARAHALFSSIACRATRQPRQDELLTTTPLPPFLHHFLLLLAPQRPPIINQLNVAWASAAVDRPDRRHGRRLEEENEQTWPISSSYFRRAGR